MTETLVGVGSLKNAARKSVGTVERELAAARVLVKAARDRGVELTGPDGLLKAITKTVLETALEEEMSEHLGYDKHAVEGRNHGNSRNGTRAKTVLTDAAGQVEIEVPRDRDGTFAPVIVGKRQRRLSDVDRVVLSLYAKGLTTGEISAHFADVYGASVAKDTVSRITDQVVEDMQAWSSRPLLAVYAAVFIDAIYVKVRDGQVGNQPFYAAIGVDLQGHRDVLGLWAGTGGGGESAKFWMSVLTDLKNRGVRDVFFIVCDGLKGLPDSVNAVFPLATVQTCIIHLIPADDWHLPVRLPPVLGRAGPGPQAHLHRRQRGRSRGGAGLPGGEVGQGLPGHPEAVAVELGGVHPVPGLRRLSRIGWLDGAVRGCRGHESCARVRGCGLRMPGCGQLSWARWILRRLKAVAARWSSLVAWSRPRRENRSRIFFRLPMPGSTVAPRRL